MSRRGARSLSSRGGLTATTIVGAVGHADRSTESRAQGPRRRVARLDLDAARVGAGDRDRRVAEQRHGEPVADGRAASAGRLGAAELADEALGEQRERELHAEVGVAQVEREVRVALPAELAADAAAGRPRRRRGPRPRRPRPAGRWRSATSREVDAVRAAGRRCAPASRPGVSTLAVDGDLLAGRGRRVVVAGRGADRRAGRRR